MAMSVVVPTQKNTSTLSNSISLVQSKQYGKGNEPYLQTKNL